MSGLLKICLTGFALLSASLGTASAATIDIVRVASDPHESVYGIRDDTGTYGRDLDGASITATYSDGSSETVAWHAVNYDYTLDGYADGADIDLFMNYDALEVTASRLMTSLSIDLVGASSVFDSAFGLFPFPDPNSTPGSSFGGAFEFGQGGDTLIGAITATYSGIVNLAGATAAGDLFTTLSLDFSDLSTGGFLGFFSFYSDMDTMRYAGDLTPVPLPASFTFLLLGLAGLGLGRRVSRRNI